MKRIQRFLLWSELNPNLIKSNSKDLINKDIDILVENVNFTWGGQSEKIDNKNKKTKSKYYTIKTTINNIDKKEEIRERSNNIDNSKQTVENSILLRNLNLKIFKGEFICIIGEVGSGKSSLIHALLGDMIYVDPQTLEEFSQITLDDKTRDILCERSLANRDIVKLGGSVGLVQQTPWIQNMTIRDNILFGLPLDEDRYNRVIEACQLESDLEILKGGDLTEIGEKGINLSGGQKARVSLARAVYSDWDILLMDDPISALDANVKQKVFEMVFWGELKHKTRVLVTHAVDFLHLADRIIVMEGGRVKYEGTFNELEHSDEIKHVIETIAKTSIKDDSHKEANLDDIIDEEPESNIQSNSIRSFLSSSGTNITEDENKELIEVGWRAYYKMFVEDNNWIMYAIVIFSFIGYSYFSVYTTYYYGDWIKHSDQRSKYWEYFILWIIHAFGYCFLITFIILLIYISTIRKSKILHSKMLMKTVNAPINIYFEKTPSGKNLNRFSGDIHTIDVDIGS